MSPQDRNQATSITDIILESSSSVDQNPLVIQEGTINQRSGISKQEGYAAGYGLAGFVIAEVGGGIYGALTEYNGSVSDVILAHMIIPIATGITFGLCGLVYHGMSQLDK